MTAAQSHPERERPGRPVRRFTDDRQSQVWPCIPAQGSVGASGDLAPLAHLTLGLMGEGSVRVDGHVMPAAEGLRRAGLTPVQLGAKEGLALLNGTQVGKSCPAEISTPEIAAADTLIASGRLAELLRTEFSEGRS